MVALQKLLVVLQKIMDCPDKDSLEYKELIKDLPMGYEKSYHRLIQYGAIMIICLHTGRRGREGIDELTKSHFMKKTTEEDGVHYAKIKGELSKNHSKDDQNLDEGGVIPFAENELGKFKLNIDFFLILC